MCVGWGGGAVTRKHMTRHPGKPATFPHPAPAPPWGVSPCTGNMIILQDKMGGAHGKVWAVMGQEITAKHVAPP